MSGKHPLYRKSTLGCTLEDSLLDLIEEKKISENLSKTILEEFDKCVPERLSSDIVIHIEVLIMFLCSY
eukprot:gene2635-3832_t